MKQVVINTISKEKCPVEEQRPEIMFPTKRPGKDPYKRWYLSRAFVACKLLVSRDEQKGILAEQVPYNKSWG